MEDNLKAGMNPAEARYAALRSFGGIEPMKESYRERRAFAVVETTGTGRTLCSANSPQEPRFHD